MSDSWARMKSDLKGLSEASNWERAGKIEKSEEDMEGIHFLAAAQISLWFFPFETSGKRDFSPL